MEVDEGGEAVPHPSDSDSSANPGDDRERTPSPVGAKGGGGDDNDNDHGGTATLRAVSPAVVTSGRSGVALLPDLQRRAACRRTSIFVAGAHMAVTGLGNWSRIISRWCQLGVPGVGMNQLASFPHELPCPAVWLLLLRACVF